MGLYSLNGVTPDAGSCWIAPGARVIGNVTLGQDVSVWFNAVIRGDNEPIAIEARTNIQDGAVLHSDPGAPLIIGADCTIGHGAVVHGCIIREGCLIGMGATVLNKAKIGAFSIVGANTLIREGEEFPERSLIVGVPARLVKILDAGTKERLLAQADRYVANAARFAGGLAHARQ